MENFRNDLDARRRLKLQIITITDKEDSPHRILVITINSNVPDGEPDEDFRINTRRRIETSKVVET